MFEKFRRPKEPAPRLVPGNMTAMIFDACGVRPEPRTKFSGFPDNYPEWITEEEAARRQAAMPPLPTVEELMRDPNVAAVVNAFLAESAALETESH